MKQEKITEYYKREDAEMKWYLIDAKDKVLGRLASEIARIIRGKNKAIFTPNADTGDFVIVINAEHVKVTGKRAILKDYLRYSGYPGGLKRTSFTKMREKNPEYILWHAVKGMLPKNRLGNKLIRKLKVYSGNQHPHTAQKPIQINILENN